MATSERSKNWLLELQRRREERMRFEVLSMLFEAANRCADFPVDIGGFVRRLGVWEGELTEVLKYLDSSGYVRYRKLEWGTEVCLTVKGADYIERDAGRRRTVRS